MIIFMASIGAMFLVSGLNSQTFDNSKAPAIDFTAIGQQMLTYYSPALIALALTLGWCCNRSASTGSQGGNRAKK